MLAGKEGGKLVGLSGNVQGSGWLASPGKPQQPLALVQVCSWWGLLVGKVEPVAAVPALAVFQETCPSSSQCL